jgi:hypothetical protein
MLHLYTIISFTCCVGLKAVWRRLDESRIGHILVGTLVGLFIALTLQLLLDVISIGGLIGIVVGASVMTYAVIPTILVVWV